MTYSKRLHNTALHNILQVVIQDNSSNGLVI